MSNLKNYWRIVLGTLIGGIAFSLWSNVYNTFMPIFLQSGNPTFDANLKTPSFGFGASPSLTSIIMSLDNISGFLFIPYSIPVFAFAIAAMSFIMRMITTQTNGQLSLLILPFSLITLAILLTLAATLFDGIPSSAIYYAIIPSEDRGKVSGINSTITWIIGVGLFFYPASFLQLTRPFPF